MRAGVSIGATLFRGLTEPKGRRVALDLEHFVSTATRHDGAKQALPLWSPATFTDDRRRLASVEAVHAFVLDMDEPRPCLATVAAELAEALPVSWHLHTSFSSCEGAVKVRAISPLSAPTAGEDFAHVWRAVVAHLRGARISGIDPACKDASRAFFVPAIPPGDGYTWNAVAGEPLDAHAWTAAGRAILEAERATREAQARRCTMLACSLGSGARVERARRYLELMPPAVSGAQGHDATFRAALVAHGFDLSDAEALPLLLAWNAECSPPWDARDVERKLREAKRGRLPRGFLLTGRVRP